MTTKRPTLPDWFLLELDRQFQARAVGARCIADPLIEDLLPKGDEEGRDDEDAKAFGDVHGPIPGHVVLAHDGKPGRTTLPRGARIEGWPTAPKPKRLPAPALRRRP